MYPWNNETVIDFINEVHLRPELWDMKSGIYKDRNAKKDGWTEIAEKFNITSNEAYKKFRSLMPHNEEKKKKSGSAGGKSVKWFAFDSISFLLTQNTANIGIDSENTLAHATETTDTDVSAEPEEVVESETTDSLETFPNTPRPRAKRSKTTDPLLEKAQNIIRDADKQKRNEYAGFGEHIANKLSKYDDYTRAHAELKIMQVLFECDMKMQRTGPTSTYTSPSSPHYSSRRGASTSQSQYSDISTPPIENNFEYIIVPETQDVVVAS